MAEAESVVQMCGELLLQSREGLHVYTPAALTRRWPFMATAALPPSERDAAGSVQGPAARARAETPWWPASWAREARSHGGHAEGAATGGASLSLSQGTLS